MAKISLTKPTELNFKLNVEGAQETPTVRLLLKFSENFQFMIPGSVANSIATVVIPKLPILEQLKEGSVSAKLEVVTDGQYFMPWADELEVKKDLKVEAVGVESQQDRVIEDVSVTLVSQPPEEKIVEEEPEPEPELIIEDEPEEEEEIIEIEDPPIDIEDDTEYTLKYVEEDYEPEEEDPESDISLDEFLQYSGSAADLFN